MLLWFSFCPRIHLHCLQLCRMPLFGPRSLRTSVLRLDPFPSSYLCQWSPVWMCVRIPLAPVTTLPETVHVPLGTLWGLPPSLYLPNLDKTLPRVSLRLRALLPYSLPSRMSPCGPSSPENICTLPEHPAEFCIVSTHLILETSSFSLAPSGPLRSLWRRPPVLPDCFSKPSLCPRALFSFSVLS